MNNLIKEFFQGMLLTLVLVGLLTLLGWGIGSAFVIMPIWLKLLSICGVMVAGGYVYTLSNDEQDWY